MKKQPPTPLSPQAQEIYDAVMESTQRFKGLKNKVGVPIHMNFPAITAHAIGFIEGAYYMANRSLPK